MCRGNDSLNLKIRLWLSESLSCRILLACKLQIHGNKPEADSALGRKFLSRNDSAGKLNGFLLLSEVAFPQANQILEKVCASGVFSLVQIRLEKNQLFLMLNNFNSADTHTSPSLKNNRPP